MSEPESKKGIIVVIFIVIISALAVGGYFLFFHGKSPSPTTAPPESTDDEPASTTSPPPASTTSPPPAVSAITKSTLPVLKEFTQTDYSMGFNSSALEKRPSTDGPGAISYSPADLDTVNKKTGQLLTNLDLTVGSVYQINMSVGDLTIYGSSNTPNKGPIVIYSWIGTFVGNDKTTLSDPQSITVQPGVAGNQTDLTFNLKITVAGKLDFRVSVTDITDKLAIKKCTVTLLT